MNDIINASRRDMNDIRSMILLAEQTHDESIRTIAVAKYKSLCDVLHSVGLSIAMVTG